MRPRHLVYASLWQCRLFSPLFTPRRTALRWSTISFIHRVSLHTVVSMGAFFGHNLADVAFLADSYSSAVQHEETLSTSFNFRCYLVDTVHESNSWSGLREYHERHRFRHAASFWARDEIIRHLVFGVNPPSFLQILQCFLLPDFQQGIINPINLFRCRRHAATISIQPCRYTQCKTVST